MRRITIQKRKGERRRRIDVKQSRQYLVAHGGHIEV